MLKLLYLDKVVVHNFKSFKHANIKFNNGFNCILGPNGSGKSNICDALLFALGETSLKRMRVSSSAQLLSDYTPKSGDEEGKKAYVHLTFAGDTPLEISRVIRPNQTIVYKLNGKNSTRQEVLDILKANNSEINETNTITQEEITRMLNLNPKERRELIDIAAGIKEFDDKKTAALRELEKVQAKINESEIMFRERSGFLRELEKEKRDAEEYLALSETIKRLSFTILHEREKALAADLERIHGEIQGRTRRRQEIAATISEAGKRIMELNSKKDTLANKLNERSAELSSTNSIIEEINKEIAIKEEQIRSLDESLRKSEQRLEELKSELKRGAEKQKMNASLLESLKAGLSSKSKLLDSSDIDAVADDAGEDSLSDRFASIQREVEKRESALSELESQLARQQFEKGSVEKEQSSLKMQHNNISAELAGIATKSKSKESEESSIAQRIDAEYRELEKINSGIQALAKRQSEIDADNINLREQLAQLGGSSDRRMSVLKGSIKAGIHGKAYELCSYDDKYAVAVNASAGQRMSYIIVDSAEVADRAIRLMREKDLGRTSFIPLDDVKAKDTKADGLDPLLKHIKFEKRYEKAFQYIFSNTFIVSDIAEAKKIGIGQYRFVTLDGELVEPSGIITGGRIKMAVSIPMLESRLQKIAKEKEQIIEGTAKLNAESERVRRAIAADQTLQLNISIEVKHLKSEADRLEREARSVAERTEQSRKKAAELDEAIGKISAKRDEASSSMQSSKGEMSSIQSAMQRMLSKSAKSKRSKEDVEKVKAIREEVSKLKVEIATAEKENEMIGARGKEISSEISALDGELKSSKKSKAELASMLDDARKRKADMQEQVKGHDARSKSLFNEITDMGNQIAKLATEKGGSEAEVNRIEKEMIEQEGQKIQVQTRMNDIKAELISYSGVQPLEVEGGKNMDEELATSRAKLSILGTVNLKAPELYAQKSKDVDEARQKIETLENEKRSIMSMIDEIEGKKLHIFNETLDAVNSNFKSLYNHIFEGAAQLKIENPTDPFNSGLYISIQSHGKKQATSERMSGGEKSLVSILLVFAIQMRHPMALYIFDEIDASLDKENSRKLSKLIKEMSAGSQFIVVSHNDSLIAASDTAIGVSKADGESQVVGVKMVAKEAAQKV
ncbi:MAG: chromosome segregation protein SMC [Candidatus Micrarchaeota archaeon]|nr:chromosome segregation protein SMC [Candidatus Micrarchaeota archaeon]